MDSEKQIYWSGHIADQKSSGQSQQGYCKEHGLNFHSFSYWTQKFKGNRSPKPKSSKFLPVSLKSRSTSSAYTYELTLTSGFDLRLSKGFDLEEVKTLLSIISK